MTLSYLALRNVSFTYPGQESPAVKDVSLDIHPGQKIALVGNNGSGKSTLAKLMLGLLRPERGTIILDNKPIREYSLPQVGRKLGYIPQNPNQMIFNTSVFDEINFGLKWKGKTAAEAFHICKMFLEHFGIWSLKGRRPLNLSEGQKQLVVIIAVLVLEPACLILDEPTKNLDTGSKLKLLGVLEDIASRGMGIILITHDKEFVESFHGQTIQMDKGEICCRQVLMQGLS